MKILITGAAGYIGSILVPELLKLGHKVTALDNFMYGQTALLDCCYDSNLTIVRGDARDETLMKKLVKQADVIIPLACLVGAPVCEKKPIEARTINLDAVKMLLDLSSKNQMVVCHDQQRIRRRTRGHLLHGNPPMNPISL